MINRVKMQPTEWETISVNHVFDKRLIFRIENFSNSEKKLIKNWQRGCLSDSAR